MSRLFRTLSLSAVAVGILVLASADSADAHVCMEFPVSRVGPECSARSPQKVGPCGIEGRSEHVNEFRPGETIALLLNETVDHPSHYRVSFNPEGDSFYDPEAVDDIDESHPYVLVDGIEDEDEARQSVEITFPEIECDACTLQLIQVMYDKQGNGFGGRDASGGNDDLYYSCADIVLSGEPVTEADQAALAVPAGPRWQVDERAAQLLPVQVRHCPAPHEAGSGHAVTAARL